MVEPLVGDLLQKLVFSDEEIGLETLGQAFHTWHIKDWSKLCYRRRLLDLSLTAAGHRGRSVYIFVPMLNKLLPYY